MSATIKEIAERTGLSLPTVKQVLGNRGHLYAAQTRQRILQTARELGYRPNTAARAMSTGKFGAVGLLMSSHLAEAMMPTQVLWGLQHEFARRETHMLIGEMPDDKLTSEDAMPRILSEWAVDGLLVNYTANYPEAMLDLIRRHNIPSIWLNAKLEGDCVYPDDFAAGRVAAEHLLQLGHRRIGYVNLEPNPHYSSTDRREGVAKAARNAGAQMSVFERKAVSTDSTRLNFYTHVLRQADRPTAVVTYGASDSDGMQAAALALGMQLPRDLSIVTIAHDYSGVALDTTAVLLPLGRLATTAVETLSKKMLHPQRVLEPRVVPGRFFQGLTSAAPPELVN